MLFSHNAIELCLVTINEKPWTRAREVRRVLEYGNATKTAHVSPENYAQKNQMSSVPAAFTSVRKGCMSCYFQVNNQGQKISGDTAVMCCFLMFGRNSVISHMRWKLKIVQVLEFTNKAHQQAIEEKDVKIALLNDDLKNCEY